MSSAPPRRALLRSTFLGLASQYTFVLVQAVLGVVTLAVLSRLLRPEDFGLIGMATVFVGFAALLSQMGVAPALIQRRELSPEHVRVAVTLSLAMGVLMTLVGWGIAPWMGRFFRTEAVIPIIRALSFNFVLVSLGVVAQALLERELEYGKLLWADVAALSLGTSLTAIVLAALGFGPWALVGGSWGQHLIRSAVVCTLRPHPRRPLVARKEAGELLSLAGGFTLARVFNYVGNQGDYLVVGRVLGAGALGLYTRAYRLMMLPVAYFARVLTKVLFPVMARMQDQPGRLRTTYLTGSAIIALVTAPLSALLVITAPELVRVLLGPGWDAAVLPFQILSVGILFRAGYMTGDSLARALGIMYERSKREAVYAGLVLAGSLAGLRWGLPGVSVGILGAVLVNYVLAAAMSLRPLECGWGDYLRSQLPGLTLAGLAIACAWPVRSALVEVLPPAPLLLLTFGVTGVALAAALLLRPAFVLGADGSRAVLLLGSLVGSKRFPPGVARRLERLAQETSGTASPGTT
ncbi:MAG: lipopolysaccharide biosynthesis protein [Gemmatimonadota bacterium]